MHASYTVAGVVCTFGTERWRMRPESQGCAPGVSRTSNSFQSVLRKSCDCGQRSQDQVKVGLINLRLARHLQTRPGTLVRSSLPTAAAC